MCPSRSLLLTALLCGNSAVYAAPAVLATLAFDESYSLTSIGQPSTALDLRFSYSLAPGGLADIDTLVFDGRAFTAAEQGTTLRLTSALDDPELPAFLDRATNGSDDDLRNDALGNAGGGRGLVAPESSRLVLHVPATGPDLQGHVITALELYIAELFIDPAAGSSQPHWQVSGELRFIGEPAPVPLPGTLALFASALACAWRRRRLATA